MSNMRIIRRITAIRARNNRLWMELLKISLDAAPRRTKTILKAIARNDRTIISLTRKLS